MSEFVQSLERGLAVIKAFDADHPSLTLSEVARATGLTRAAARRFLLTLTELGYVRTDGKHFALRPRVLELGYAYLSSLSLPDVARPHMEQLVGSLQESCSLAVLDGDEIVYVARIPTNRVMTVSITVGTRFPAYATAMGRVLLAFSDPAWLSSYLDSVQLKPLTRNTVVDPAALRSVLGEVAGQGWALVDQELEEGLRSIAVPVRGPSGAVVAAVNVSAHANRGNATSVLEDLLPPLRAIAALIEEDLRARA